MGMSTYHSKKQSIRKNITHDLGNKWMATIKGHKNFPYLYPMKAFQPVSMQFRWFPFSWVLHSPLLFSCRLEHKEFFYFLPAPVRRASWLFVYIAWGLMTWLPRSRAFRSWFQFSRFAVIQYGGMLKQHVTCRFVRFAYLRSKVLCRIQIVWGRLCCRRKRCAEIQSWWEYIARYKYYLASQTTYYKASGGCTDQRWIQK